MKATILYQCLEIDFINIEMSDDWAQYMDSISDFLSDNFKKRSMGLVCDFTTEIKNVYTAVFPSRKVLQRILDDGAQDALLFVHHPSIWDIRKAPEVFQQMEKSLLREFKNRRISIYNLHVPLDNFGKYSTSVSLANALGIKTEKPFAPYFGALAGVFGKAELLTIQELKKAFEKTLGHEVSLYNYGKDIINEEIVAVVAGGGLMDVIIEEIVQNNVNTFITGISIKNDHSERVHELAEKHRINILGGTHYSTEKFACMAMCNYFKKTGLPSEFIADQPVMEDL